jgi:hypothetical protein
VWYLLCALVAHGLWANLTDEKLKAAISVSLFKDGNDILPDMLYKAVMIEVFIIFVFLVLLLIGFFK